MVYDGDMGYDHLGIGAKEGRALNGNHQCIAGGELFTQSVNLDSLFQPRGIRQDATSGERIGSSVKEVPLHA